MRLMVLFVLFGLIITAVILLYLAYLKTQVVPMPTTRSERSALVQLTRQSGHSGDITDLGSGWGGAARIMARHYPERTVTAVEYSLVPHLMSRLLTRVSGLANVRHLRQNFLNMSLSEGQIYTAYLSGPVMKDLGVCFERAHLSGSILISVAFAVPGWAPVKTITTSSLMPTTVYLYDLC